MFNRLNTGSSPLSEQEIRNCIFRSYSVDLNQVLRDISVIPKYVELISPSEKKNEEMFLEELVLRYFAFKDLEGSFKTTVAQFLTEFMRDVSKGDKPFDIEKEKDEFIMFIEFILDKFGKAIFRPKGNFANHIFDSLAFAVPKTYDSISGNEEKIESSIRALLADEEYNLIGTSTFSNMRIRARMDRAMEIFAENA